MMTINWLVLVMGYGFFTWAAGRFSKAALSFWNGGYLAFLCLAALPEAMGTAYFFRAVPAALLGVFLGVRTEGNRHLPLPVFAAVTGLWLFDGSASVYKVLLQSFFGGIGLYHASAAIIPEKAEIGTALLCGGGFLAGTILFVGF